VKVYTKHQDLTQASKHHKQSRMRYSPLRRVWRDRDESIDPEPRLNSLPVLYPALGIFSPIISPLVLRGGECLLSTPP